MRALQVNFLVDKTNIRMLKILNILERKKIASSKELSSHTSSTVRTLISDIGEIRQRFATCINLVSRADGYEMEIIDLEKFNETKREVVEYEPLYILFKAIFYGELYTVGEWTERLHLSENSLRRYLRQITPVLDEYGLSLTFTPLNLTGNELNIRKFFLDFFYEVEATPHTVFPSLFISQVVKTFFSDHVSTPTGMTPGELSYIFYITIERVSKGNIIQVKDDLLLKFKDSIDFSNFMMIENELYEHYSINLPDSELLFVFLLYITRRRFQSEDEEAAFVHAFDYWPGVTEISQQYVETFHSHSPDRETITYFTEAVFLSIKINDLLAPVLNKNLDDLNTYINDNFTEEVSKMACFFEEQNKLLKINSGYMDNVINTLVLYNETIQDLFWQDRSKKLCFILEGNAMMRVSLEAKAKMYLAHYHYLYFPSFLDISEDFLKENEFDLLITNYDEFWFDINQGTETIIIKSIPDIQDWNRILNKVNPRITKLFTLNMNES